MKPVDTFYHVFGVIHQKVVTIHKFLLLTVKQSEALIIIVVDLKKLGWVSLRWQFGDLLFLLFLP